VGGVFCNCRAIERVSYLSHEFSMGTSSGIALCIAALRVEVNGIESSMDTAQCWFISRGRFVRWGGGVLGGLQVKASELRAAVSMGKVR
jgi:hypothetical protein